MLKQVVKNLMFDILSTLSTALFRFSVLYLAEEIGTFTFIAIKIKLIYSITNFCVDIFLQNAFAVNQPPNFM